MEYQGAVDASERHARVTAKQHEVAYLQHLLDQVGALRLTPFSIARDGMRLNDLDLNLSLNC
eukprot:1160295-Pelagomonas_calceolata.AAC.3